VARKISLGKLEWVSWLMLAIASFVVSILIVSYGWQLVAHAMGAAVDSETVTILSQSMTIYLLAFAMTLGSARLLGLKVTRDELGIRWLRWRDIGIAVLAMIAYVLIGTLVMNLLQVALPGLPLDQRQDLGFTEVYGGERLLAFIVFVIIAPVVEELVFRGLLYGKMRRSGINIVVSTLIVSLLFALAHGQLNVGIDVFLLSIVLCLVREYTGGIGAPIVIHMLKNMLAFYVLFVVGAQAIK